MIKVFLVEDEYAIREGIKKSVDWEKNGFELVGEAGDGEMAFPKILKTKPDILITDIRMPFMDGLELATLVKKELSDIKIVVLSGYDDYWYGDYGYSLLTDDVICDKCGNVFQEYETIPVEMPNHALKYICPDCLSVDEVGWCANCGEAYELSENYNSNFCYSCKRDLDKRKQEQNAKKQTKGTGKKSN